MRPVCPISYGVDSDGSWRRAPDARTTAIKRPRSARCEIHRDQGVVRDCSVWLVPDSDALEPGRDVGCHEHVVVLVGTLRRAGEVRPDRPLERGRYGLGPAGVASKIEP